MFFGRAILEIIAREGHTKHVIALCFQPNKTLDFTQTCNKKYLEITNFVLCFHSVEGEEGVLSGRQKDMKRVEMKRLS